MMLRFVQDSIRRAPRRKALIIAAIAMGSAVATSMLGVMLSIGDKVNRELRAAGANIVVTMRAASLTGGVGTCHHRHRRLKARTTSRKPMFPISRRSSGA